MVQIHVGPLGNQAFMKIFFIDAFLFTNDLQTILDQNSSPYS